MRLRACMARWKWRNGRSAVDPDSGRVRVTWLRCSWCSDGGWMRIDVPRPLCPYCKAYEEQRA